jgi:hypothetical protein
MQSLTGNACRAVHRKPPSAATGTVHLCATGSSTSTHFPSCYHVTAIDKAFLASHVANYLICITLYTPCMAPERAIRQGPDPSMYQ